MAESLDVRKAAEDYKKACSEQGAPANPLVVASLEDSEGPEFSASGRFFVAAPGSSAQVFSARIDDGHVGILAGVLAPRVQFLQRLDLSYNLISDAGVLTLVGMLGNASALRYLKLAGNDVGPKGCQALCAGLRSCSELRSLDLSKNPIKNYGGLAVAEFLQRNELLHELNLEDTDLEIDALVALAAVLHCNNSTLRVFNVSRPRLFTLEEEHVMHLGLCLRVNTGLKKVHFGMHQIYDSGVSVLVHYLVENRTLRTLDLRSNQIGWKGAASLGVLLEYCPLEELNLANNRIGEHGDVSGAEALAKGITASKSLVKVDLNHNQLCGDALSHVANAAVENQTLGELRLFHNDFSQKAAGLFDRLLKNISRIQVITADFSLYVVDGQYHIAECPF